MNTYDLADDASGSDCPDHGPYADDDCPDHGPYADDDCPKC